MKKMGGHGRSLNTHASKFGHVEPDVFSANSATPIQGRPRAGKLYKKKDEKRWRQQEKAQNQGKNKIKGSLHVCSLIARAHSLWGRATDISANLNIDANATLELDW